MSEKETKSTEPSLADVIGNCLAAGIKQCCLGGLKDKSSVDLMNALLDASIKFNQLIIITDQSEQVQEANRRKRAAFEAEQLRVQEAKKQQPTLEEAKNESI